MVSLRSYRGAKGEVCIMDIKPCEWLQKHPRTILDKSYDSNSRLIASRRLVPWLCSDLTLVTLRVSLRTKEEDFTCI